jgi:hypothetical protein
MISDPPSPPRPDPAPDLPAPTSVQTWTDRQSSVLFRSGVIGTLVLLAYFAVVAQVEDPLHRYQGLTMIVLSLLPGLAWARRPDTAFPMFQTFMMTGLNSFAIPLLAGHEQLVRYPPESVSAAAWGVILFQVTALLAYRTVPGIPRTTRAWTTPLFEGRIEPHLRLGMTVTTLYTGVAAFTPWIPTEINSVLRAVCFGGRHTLHVPAQPFVGHGRVASAGPHRVHRVADGTGGLSLFHAVSRRWTFPARARPARLRHRRPTAAHRAMPAHLRQHGGAAQRQECHATQVLGE